MLLVMLFAILGVRFGIKIFAPIKVIIKFALLPSLVTLLV